MRARSPWPGLAAGVVALSVVLVALAPPGIRVFSTDGMDTLYRSIGYAREALFAGEASVPRLYLARIPRAWGGEIGIETRKDAFFRTLLPLVLKANEEIAADRARLLALRGRLAGGAISTPREARWLHALARRYEVVGPDDAVATASYADRLATLVRRVDTVPPSLALAQAAVESAYGASRFAIEGNAIYGEWRYGTGMLPEAQRAGLGDYRIAAFDRPLDAVRAYMLNLNTHRAYRGFRVARAGLPAPRHDAGPVLAAALAAYSERGEDYVALLREVIAGNSLHRLDGAKLRDGPSRDLIWGLF